MRAFQKVNWKQVQKAMPAIPDISLNAYYRGGFESKMSKREASLILGKLSWHFVLVSHNHQISRKIFFQKSVKNLNPKKARVMIFQQRLNPDSFFFEVTEFNQWVNP